MRVLKKIGIGILLVLLIAVIGGYVYLQTTKPKLSGELTLPGINEDAEIYFDAYGVPHIYAQSERDAYYALGYVHAQDRLFQMEMIRRVAAGRLAEVLGEEQLNVDKLFRTLGLNTFAREQAQRYLSSDTSRFQQAALAYIAGINAYIDSGNVPVEFRIMGMPLQKFAPEDIYLAGGFMSFGFAEGLRADPVLQKLLQQHGADYLEDLVLISPADAQRIRNYAQGTWIAHDSLIAQLHTTLEQIPIPLWHGSNGWVVSGKKSTSGFPILANDTHIGFSQPAVWYEAHIEYPGFSFYGHHVAGIPFGLLGNNRHAGWGLTMFENDDTDFFIETINPENENEVRYKDTWEKISVREEVIHIKNKDSFTLKVKKTRHGSIMNGIVDGIDSTLSPVALTWTLTELPNPFLQAIYKLNHATNLKEAHEAAAMMTAPGLNVMYGDVHGNIAWWAVARLPIRQSHTNSKLFFDGASGNDDYLGYYDFSKNPKAINPPWGYVYSTNNQPDSVDGVLYPGYYYPKARAGRVVELLEKQDKFSQEDMRSINLDVVSITAPEVAKEFATILRNQNDFSEIVSVLESWNGDHKVDDVAPTIYYSILSFTLHALMEDELGDIGFKALMNTSILKSSYHKLISNEHSVWWDNVNIKTKETRSEIITQATKKTTELLTSKFGSSISDWKWRYAHSLTHKHPLGAVKPLDKLFNVGPFEAPGGIEVLNNLMFSLDTTANFQVISGPALRKITDFGNIENGETISPTGQSANIMSKHYNDQAEMFVTGKSRKMLMNRDEIVANSQNKLTLKPIQK